MFLYILDVPLNANRVSRDYLTMIKENWLSNVCFTTVQTNVDLSAVRQTRGDFDLAELSQAVNTAQANDITVKAWLEKASGQELVQ